MPKILIADDNNEMLDTLARIFTLYDFDVVKALDGQQAIDNALQTRPDIIVLDGAMPVMDGFEACQHLKKETSTKDIPVVFLTANFMELRDRIKGLELGADDYLLKPFNSKELVDRIKTILHRADITRQLKEENTKLVKHNSIIENELNQLLEKQNIDNKMFSDPVTGLYAYDFFKQRAAYELKRARRFQHDLSLIIITVDKISKIKENLGTQLFNYMVLRISNFLLTETREVDLISFDETKGFYILLPQTDLNGAITKSDKIYKRLCDQNYISEYIIGSLDFSRKKMSDFSKVKFMYGIGHLGIQKSTEEIDFLFELAETDMKEKFLQ
ncbi:MAG: response regulator [Calditrichae bacterium]|nr:response regulator [Calditrichota bacterium]MCB9059001.1 response regulator [Calditrichia bacterium]